MKVKFLLILLIPVIAIKADNYLFKNVLTLDIALNFVNDLQDHLNKLQKIVLKLAKEKSIKIDELKKYFNGDSIKDITSATKYLNDNFGHAIASSYNCTVSTLKFISHKLERTNKNIKRCIDLLNN